MVIEIRCAMISETGGNRLGKIVVDTKQECATNTLEKSGNFNINCEFSFDFENASNDVIKKALIQIIVTYSGVPKGPDGVEIVCGAHSRGIQPVQ